MTGDYKFIDTHAHLDDRKYSSDLNEVLDRARERDVNTIITVGTTVRSSQIAVSIANRDESIYATAGIHPHAASTVNDDVVTGITQILKSEQIVAVGEIGLDYYRDLSPRPVQRDVFRRFLNLAVSHSLPVVVHSRDAHEEVLTILDQELSDEHTVIMHCFSANFDIAMECEKRGYYLSFAGPLTFKKSDQLRQIACDYPPHLILTETDCPYLAPHPFRGKRCEPAYVVEVANLLAGLCNVNLKDMAGQIFSNAVQAFNLKKSGDDHAG